MSKTTRKDKEQGYDISANNDPLEQKHTILRDALSHMEEATVYWQLLKHSLGSTMTLDVVSTRWLLDAGVNV